MKSALALFVVLLGIWLLASGHYTPMLVSFGVLSCLFVVVLGLRMGVVDSESVPVHLTLRGLAYVPWFVAEVAKSNVDVARRVLAAKPRISPVVFEVEATQRTDLGQVLFANSITLTPGTVSIIAGGGKVTVHAIAADVADGLRDGRMDARVTRLEGGG